MIVLDTNVVSEAMKPEPNPTVRAWLNNQANETLAAIIRCHYSLFGVPRGNLIMAPLTSCSVGFCPFYGAFFGAKRTKSCTSVSAWYSVFTAPSPSSLEYAYVLVVRGDLTQVILYLLVTPIRAIRRGRWGRHLVVK